MIEIIDLDTVIVDSVSQDLVSAIANNLQGDLGGILKALKAWNANRSSEVDESAISNERKTLEADRLTWQQSDAAKDAEIGALKLKLAPAIAEIADELLRVALFSWGNAASTAAGNVSTDLGDQVMALIIDLKITAIEPPSIRQCDRIKQIFGTICHLSGVEPTAEQTTALNAVLDQGCPSTGPVSSKYLRFR